MSTNVQIFTNPEFGEIEVVIIDGKKHIEAIPCAKALGYADPHKAIKQHCRYPVKHPVPHPQSPDKTIEKLFIPESDLYRLIVRSELPAAEKFERWVFDEVLPSIMATGSYSALPSDKHFLLIDNVPMEIPMGVPFSVSRSKTGVLTMRVKPASTPTKAPAPASTPLVSQIAPPKPKPKPKTPPTPKGVTLTGKYAQAADKIVKYLYKVRGELITNIIFKDKKIVPWEITYHEYNEILRLLHDKGTIVLHESCGCQTMTPNRY